MKKCIFLIALIFIFLNACKQKKDPEASAEQKEDFFPVLSFLKSQVAEIDTSLFSIKKITVTDSIHSDTVFIPREEFRSLAKDFLDIPDLAEKKYKKRFSEEKLFDESLNRVIITYTPIDPDKEEIQKQEVLITPNPTGDKVNNIIIDRVASNKDGFLQQRMLWQVDRSFQVTTTSQKPAQPETTKTLKVTWNDKEEE
ncbi:MAG: hypothetical protein ABUT20_01885 [Bacteroidota bacterium]